MKIDNIKINGFGKIQNKNIEFQDGINIVYGQNESGKSTILKYIFSALYGISKNKNGKNISDFEKYNPWENDNFSGKIEYTLENGEKYEVFRDFKRRKATIYNEFSEDISKNFTVDKAKQIDFLNQQIGANETLFFNTSFIQQQSVKLDKNSTGDMVQKMSNLVSTGSDNISFKTSLEKINKMQLEAVGTERTKQRPLNIVNDTIKKLEEEKKELSYYKEKVNDKVNDKLDLALEELNAKKKFLKEINQYVRQEKVKNEEIEFEKKLEQEYFQEVNEIREEIAQKNESSTRKNEKFKLLIGKIVLILLVLVSIAIVVFAKNKLLVAFGIIPIIIDLIFMKRQNGDSLGEADSQLTKDYEIALKTYNKKKQEIEDKQKRMQSENKKVKKEIMEQYKKSLSIGFMGEKTNLSEMQIEGEIENIDKKIGELKLQNHMLKLEKENMDDKLEKLVKIEENLEEQRKIQAELIELDTSFNIAKNALSQAYEEIKHGISPKFEESLSDIIFHITNGKYNHIALNDESGLIVELENGEYVPVDRLSIGTIDEMYFGLRLSMADEVAQEKLPILLDETFAYFDDNRLQGVMRYLQDKKYDNQIIIFTCSKREENALNKLKIEYNLISLEK